MASGLDRLAESLFKILSVTDTVSFEVAELSPALLQAERSITIKEMIKSDKLFFFMAEGFGE